MPSQKYTENLLLRSLPKEALSRLLPEMEEVDLQLLEMLSEPQDELKYVYFPDRDTLVSMISTTGEADTAEVAIVGWEGMLGYGACLGQRLNMHRLMVQMSGKAMRAKVKDFNQVCKSEPSIQRVVLRFVDFLLAQVSQTALCNRLHPVESRLARWLLMSDDRVESNRLPFTHETLSHMLGTRRSTVSLTAATLQAAGLIQYNRGKITILNRKGLENAACSCYPIMISNLKSLIKNLSSERETTRR